ncbi:MAG: NAD(P)/FAD-dependent oxidoreductase [Acidisphaera sp.]|nr:NAD(P)/FAD-dependent oxidoreductase [Acidisphaera sp.]
MTACIYDVAIVGAGPAGATCAWYLARAGVRVALLEKHAFPRDKICGDAVCSRAQLHLSRMGVLQQIFDNGEAHAAAIGGMVSPGGVVAIGNSVEHIASSPVIAVRRVHLDQRIARAAAEAGAALIERFEAVDATLDGEAGLWTIDARRGASCRARVLVAADGALSRLARRLGIVGGAPEAVCSRAYIDASSSDFPHDGVAFYPRDLLPGYCALFREAGGQLNFCLYLIPGGQLTVHDLRRTHDRVMREDPFVSRAIGARAAIGAMRGAPLRLGGIPRSYGERLLILGDAAGQIDPLTGEGIQYGMDAAEIAAATLVECLAEDDFRAARLSRYHRRWRRAFGNDFAWSARIARLCSARPGLLDAGALALRRDGAPLLAKWAEVMTGARPKLDFLKPGLALPVLAALGRLALRPAALQQSTG